jgi:hypothetical protein
MGVQCIECYCINTITLIANNPKFITTEIICSNSDCNSLIKVHIALLKQNNNIALIDGKITGINIREIKLEKNDIKKIWEKVVKNV